MKLGGLMSTDAERAYQRKYQRVYRQRPEVRAKVLAQQAAYWAKNKERLAAQSRAYRMKNIERERERRRRAAKVRYDRDPEKMRVRAREAYHRRADAARAQKREATYGVSATQYDELVAQQEGRCAICGNEAKLVVDHDHVTGELRGLLCGGCNTGIGLLRDSARVLNRAALYVGTHTKRVVVKAEAKVGAQVPAAFLRLIESDWFRSALGQAAGSIAVGAPAYPAVYLQPPGREGRWLVVRLS